MLGFLIKLTNIGLLCTLSKQEEGWAVCKVFKKRIPSVRTLGEPGSLCWYDDPPSFMPNLASPNQISNPNCNPQNYHTMPYHCKKELDLHYQSSSQEHFLQLPYLNNPKLSTMPFSLDMNQLSAHHHHQSSSSLTQDENLLHSLIGNKYSDQEAVDQVTDWRVLDKFVASQLSQQEVHDEVTTNPIETDDELTAM